MDACEGPEIDIDALGLKCPLPVLRLRKRLKKLDIGAVISILADDPAAVVDVPFFCIENGHELIELTSTDGAVLFKVRKG